jgi:4'-phosphopantetheinyl transferase
MNEPRHGAVAVPWPSSEGPDRPPRPHHVHLWCARLPCDEDEIAAFTALLDGEERRRLDTFRFARDRRRFAARRGILRELLARYVRCPPGRVRLDGAAGGRPVVVVDGPEASRAAALHVSLSHSDDLALMGVAADRPLGVDVERLIDTLPEAEPIAAQHFSAAERMALAGTAPDARSATFLRCWTRKEAYLKASGRGLLEPMDGFSVLAASGDACAPDGWSVLDVQPADGFVGAVAVAGPAPSLAFRRWTCRPTRPPPLRHPNEARPDRLSTQD